MAIALTHLTGGVVSTNGGATGTITSTTGKVFLTVAVSVVGGGETDEGDSIALSGGGVTWNAVGSNKVFGMRRGIYVFLSDGKPSSGTVTVTYSSNTGATWESFKYSADEVTGEDSTTPTGTVAVADLALGASLTVTVVGTPDAGDFVFAAIGLEDNNDTARGSELDTDLYELGDATGARHFHVAYDSSPDSSPAPGITWTGDCGAGALAFIINVAAGGASATPSSTPSATPSLTPSATPSVSATPSATPEALTEGSTCWGHITGVLEDNVRTFADNWTGTGVIAESGNAERLELDASEYMISEVVITGAVTITLLQNNYAAGEDVIMQYRDGATEETCLAAEWITYTNPFVSLGYMQIRMEGQV